MNNLSQLFQFVVGYLIEHGRAAVAYIEARQAQMSLEETLVLTGAAILMLALLPGKSAEARARKKYPVVFKRR